MSTPAEKTRYKSSLLVRHALSEVSALKLPKEEKNAKRLNGWLENSWLEKSKGIRVQNSKVQKNQTDVKNR